MTPGDSRFGSVTNAVTDLLGKGRPFDAVVDQAWFRLFRTPVGREGLSRIFQPGFPGVRTFVVDARVESDGAVSFTIAGMARDGTPAFIGRRTCGRGRMGTLELHRSFDELAPAFRWRNITSDLIRRELELLDATGAATSPRITLDATEAARYLAAVHGFSFADESKDGPPGRSIRARDPASDREILAAAAHNFARRLAARHSTPPAELDRLARDIDACRQPIDFVRLDLPGAPLDPSRGDGPDARPFGRAFLRDRDTPSYRATLYTSGPGRSPEGDRYRDERTHRSEARLATEMQAHLDELAGRSRASRVRALDALAPIAPTWVLSEIRQLSDDPDRKVATAARQAIRRIGGSDLVERVLAFGDDAKNPPEARATAYRVVSEFFPTHISSRLPMLRIDPDARIQKSVIPVIAEWEDAAPELGAMLGANPSNDLDRPGLGALRLELINRLAALADPRTLPILMAGLAQDPAPEEASALSRALIAHPDPRARLALAARTQNLDIPPVP